MAPSEERHAERHGPGPPGRQDLASPHQRGAGGRSHSARTSRRSDRKVHGVHPEPPGFRDCHRRAQPQGVGGRRGGPPRVDEDAHSVTFSEISAAPKHGALLVDRGWPTNAASSSGHTRVCRVLHALVRPLPPRPLHVARLVGRNWHGAV